MPDKAELIEYILEAIRELKKQDNKSEPIKVNLGNGTLLVIKLDETEKRNFFIIRGDD